MSTIIKMMVSIVSMVLKLTWKIVKFLGKPLWESLRDTAKTSWSLYKERKEKKAVSAASSKGDVGGSGTFSPDENVQFTAKDLKDKFIDYEDEDLQHMLDLMTDNAVKVDKNPKMEELLETYGADQEIMKQEIMDELKRRSMKSKKQGKQDIEDDKG